MGLDRTVFDDILKEDYLPPIRDQLNNKTLLLSRIQRNTEDVEGKRAYMPLSVGRNEGIGARAEGGTLPTAGQQAYDSATWNMKYLYGRIQVSGPVMESAATDQGAFTRAVDSEVKGLVRDLTHDINRILYGNGDCNLALMTTTAGAATGTVTSEGGSLRYLRVGQIVDCLLAAGTGFSAATGSPQRLQITAINETTKLVTFAQTDVAFTSFTGAVANTRIIRTATMAFTPACHEPYGLAAIVSDTNPSAATGSAGAGLFGNIDRSVAANDYWKGNILNAGATPLSLDLLEQAKDVSDIKGDGDISIYLGDHATYRAYARLLVPDRRYPTADGKPIMLDGGFTALEYDGIPFVNDKHAPPVVVYALDESTIMLFEMGDFDWMDKDGAILSRVPNQDAYEATLKKYCQLGCEDCANNVKITNFTV